MAEPAKVFAQAILSTEVDQSYRRLDQIFAWIFNDDYAMRIYAVMLDVHDSMIRKHAFLKDPDYALSLLWIEPDDTEDYLATEAAIHSIYKTTDLDKALERMSHAHIKRSENGFWVIWGEENSSRYTAFSDLLFDYLTGVFDPTRARQKLSTILRNTSHAVLADAAKKLAGKSGGPESIGEFVDMAKRIT